MTSQISAVAIRIATIRRKCKLQRLANSHTADGANGVCTKRRTLRHTAKVIFCQERSPHHGSYDNRLDLGKDVCKVHGITADGTVAFNRSIRRRQLLKFFETLPRCLVGIEACGSAHHWARELTAIGHDVRLMPATYVKPYVKRGKTDAVDAEAICEAVTRPTMRFVAVKSKEQQALLTIHRVRQLIVRQKTQMLNVISGLLREFGHVIGSGPVAAMRFIKAFKTDDDLDMPDVAKSMLKTLCEQVVALDERVTFYDKLIEYHSRIDERAKRIRAVPRVWLITASAIVATSGDGKQSKNGREFTGLAGADTR
ncbi:IS110 family transposase [Roseobacter cerasinus]|nr:IS110 family transposase [Roseobacter cerasinus]